MAIKTDRTTLTKELKAATKDSRYFVYAPGKTPGDSVLIVSKKQIPTSEHKNAKKSAGSAKVYAGTCFKEGPALVFECDRPIPDTFGKTLKEAIKKLTDFVPPKLAARLDPALAGKVLDAVEAAAEKKEEVPKLPAEDETLDVAKGLEKLGVKPPSFDTPESDDPAVKALADTERDLEKAKSYVEYITKALTYAEKAGDYTGIEDVSRASQQLGAVTKRISSAVGKAGEKVAKAKKIANWLVAMRDFVDASNGLDVTQRRTFKDWAKTLERLFDTSTALVDWSKMVNAAAAGSYAAGVAFFTLAFVGSQVFIGIKTLRQGIDNVDAYFERMNRILKESERDATGRPPKGAGPKPAYPGDYMSPEEEAQDEQERREWDRERMKESNEKRARFDAKEQFDEREFVKLYLAQRAALRKQIYAAIAKGHDDDAPSWWDSFMPGNGEAKLVGGVYVHPSKAKVSADEARQEIAEFHGLKPPCPYFKDFYDKALEAFVKKSGAAPANPFLTN